MLFYSLRSFRYVLNPFLCVSDSIVIRCLFLDLPPCVHGRSLLSSFSLYFPIVEPNEERQTKARTVTDTDPVLRSSFCVYSLFFNAIFSSLEPQRWEEFDIVYIPPPFFSMRALPRCISASSPPSVVGLLVLLRLEQLQLYYFFLISLPQLYIPSLLLSSHCNRFPFLLSPSYLTPSSDRSHSLTKALLPLYRTNTCTPALNAPSRTDVHRRIGDHTAEGGERRVHGR
jgi:hypothetical protein